MRRVSYVCLLGFYLGIWAEVSWKVLGEIYLWGKAKNLALNILDLRNLFCSLRTTESWLEMGSI